MLIKYWKNYFFKIHTKDIITNGVVMLLALIIYYFSEFIVLATIIFIFSILYLLFIFYFYYHAVLSGISKRKKYYNELSIELSEDSIFLMGSMGESKMKWEACSKVVEGKEYYLLFDKVDQFLVIPKEVFNSVDEITWFKNRIKGNGIIGDV
jgi:uncharacterized protein YacL